MTKLLLAAAVGGCVVCVASTSIEGQCSQANIGSPSGQNETCKGTSTSQVTAHTKFYPFSVTLRCNYSGWYSQGMGGSSVGGVAFGQCGNASEGTNPICPGLHEGPFDLGIVNGNHRLQLAAYDRSWTGTGCGDLGTGYYYGDVPSEDCSGNICCGLAEQCGNLDGTWNSAACECSASPILIDLGRNGFDLTSAANGVFFDLWATGTPYKMGWTTPGGDDAFLALDRNANGVIDDGTELFGNVTEQPVPVPPGTRNGFAALAVLDVDRDGAITERDPAFDLLRLWTDSNHNGASEPRELKTLRAVRLMEIRLDYRETRRRDRHGNLFRYGSEGFVGRNRDRVLIFDVFFVGARSDTRR